MLFHFTSSAKNHKLTRVSLAACKKVSDSESSSAAQQQILCMNFLAYYTKSAQGATLSCAELIELWRNLKD